MPTQKVTVGKAITVDESTHTLTAVMSTRNVDRDGDIIEPQGLDMQNFLKNPVVLWMHDKHLLPIGKVMDVYVSEDAVLGVIKFDETDKFAMDIFRKYLNGFLSTWSISFAPDPEETVILRNSDDVMTGYHFKKSELLELSSVPVPANPEALVRELEETGDRSLAIRYAKSLSDSKDIGDEIKNIALKYIQKSFSEKDHSNEKGDNEPNWSSVEVAALPLAAFVYGSKGISKDDASTWVSPHHWIQNPGDKNSQGIWTTGTMLVHKDAVKQAWAKILGARSSGPISIEEINHLQEHRKALGLDEGARGKHYVWVDTKEGQTIFVERAFEKMENADEDLHEATEIKLIPEQAFKKSLEERGDKIKTNILQGKENKIEIDFEAIQIDDGLVKEAKILQIMVTLPTSTEPAQSAQKNEPDRATDETGEENANGNTEMVDASAVVDDLDKEILEYRAKVALL